MRIPEVNMTIYHVALQELASNVSKETEISILSEFRAIEPRMGISMLPYNGLSEYEVFRQSLEKFKDFARLVRTHWNKTEHAKIYELAWGGDKCQEDHTYWEIVNK